MLLLEDDIKRLEDLVLFISCNLDQDLTINALSKKLSLSKAKLQRHFCNYYKMPIHRFVLGKRMEAAYSLFHSKTKTVSEVAVTVGYKNRTSFTKAYIRYHHLRPIEHLHDLR